MMRWCAGLLLALLALGFPASAQAATIYNFAFTDLSSSHVVAAGSFTTDGPSGVDPGYDLLVSMTFDYVTGESGAVYSGPFTALPPGLHAGAAYNATTGAFINHFAGGTFHDIGDTFFTDAAQSVLFAIRGTSFALPPGGELSGGIVFLEGLQAGQLTVTPTVTAVPEPTSITLLASGVAGVILRRRRRA